jgi:antitoxin CptB
VAGRVGTVKRQVPDIQSDQENEMAGDLELRRRRASYRANHRGTKEMDWLLGRFAEARLAHMDEAALTEFERLLALADPDLKAWIIEPETAGDSELAGLLRALHAFHTVEAPAP